MIVIGNEPAGPEETAAPPGDLPPEWPQWVEALRAIDGTPRGPGTLGLFLVTLVLFFSSGLVRSTVSDVLLLVAALLLHEVGHLAAMKLLGYRDLRIFFVPFLGAAASGRTTRHSTARACLVSIMGPLPGILAGAALWIGYAATGHHLLHAGARILLFLNVFNLLPILPLDGGRYVDVLFVKSRWIRLVFALVGVAAFASLALGSQDLLLLIIAGLGLAAAITNWKLQRLAGEWTRAGIAETSIPELLSSETSAPRALESLRQAYPKLFAGGVQLQAVHTRMEAILDTVRFRPARWWSQILLGAGYLIALLAGISLLAMFIWTTPSERIRFSGAEGRILERQQFGHTVFEVPIDREDRFHGTAIVYADSGLAASRMDFVEGYRHGRTVEFGDQGDTSRVIFYSRGRLDSILEHASSGRRRILAEERPWHKRAMSWLVRIAQPQRSNHEYFQER